MNLEQLETDLIDAVSKAIILTDNDKNNEALRAAEHAKVLLNELYMEIWHRFHVSGVGPV